MFIQLTLEQGGVKGTGPSLPTFWAVRNLGTVISASRTKELINDSPKRRQDIETGKESPIGHKFLLHLVNLKICKVKTQKLYLSKKNHLYLDMPSSNHVVQGSSIVANYG